MVPQALVVSTLVDRAHRVQRNGAQLVGAEDTLVDGWGDGSGTDLVGSVPGAGATGLEACSPVN